MSFTGVSVMANGRLQQPSAVYSGTASGSGYHLLVVEGYSNSIKHMLNGTAINSRRFMLGGYRWVLRLYPNGENAESTDFISLFVILEEEIRHPVRVYFHFSFIDQVKEQAPARIRATDACDFSSSDNSWGIPNLMKIEDFEQSEHLKEDCFTIRCDLIIQEPLDPFIEVPSSNIRQHLKELLRTEVGTDVTFMVDGEKFVAHWCILATRSAVFMAELFGSMKEGTTGDIIQIQDMNASVFRALLHFIYTDSLPEMDIPSSMEVEGEAEEGKAEAVWLQHLLVAADRYDLQRLKTMCEAHLAKHIDLSSVATVVALAVQHQCSELKEACLEFLNVQSTAALQGLVKTSNWEHMSTTCPSVPNELIAKLARFQSVVRSF